MDMRETFVAGTTAILDDDPRTAVVLADISAAAFEPARERHPDRVLNVGIRESLLVGVAGGLAQTGLRPIAHTYAPFLVERAFEQIKLDFGNQDGHGVLVSVGASYDNAQAGRSHHAPGDVALIDTLPGWEIRVPGHPDEVDPLLRHAVGGDGSVYLRLSTRSNDTAHAGTDGRLVPLRTGHRAVVVAVGPMLSAVLAATVGLDVTVAYTNTVRPFDAAGLRELAGAVGDTVILVEPYLAGTSARVVDDALLDRPHRTLSLGVRRVDLHRFGTPADHDVAHGLTPDALRHAIAGFLLPG